MENRKESQNGVSEDSSIVPNLWSKRLDSRLGSSLHSMQKYARTAEMARLDLRRNDYVLRREIRHIEVSQKHGCRTLPEMSMDSALQYEAGCGCQATANSPTQVKRNEVTCVENILYRQDRGASAEPSDPI